MSDALVKRICRQWIDAGYADECFCQMYPGCSAKGNSLTPRMVFDRIEALESKLAKAVDALGILADDTNWFDAVEEDGTFSPAWRGTGSPEEIARTTLAELTGDPDGD